MQVWCIRVAGVAEPWGTAEEAARKAEGGMAPIFRVPSGFVAYELIGRNGTIVSTDSVELDQTYVGDVVRCVLMLDALAGELLIAAAPRPHGAVRPKPVPCQVAPHETVRRAPRRARSKLGAPVATSTPRRERLTRAACVQEGLYVFDPPETEVGQLAPHSEVLLLGRKLLRRLTPC